MKKKIIIFIALIIIFIIIIVVSMKLKTPVLADKIKIGDYVKYEGILIIHT